jgi:hypothetical protein
MAFFLSSWLVLVALFWAWGSVFSTVFIPLGALAALACLYFSWSETLLWVLSLGLVVESLLPVPWGNLAIPLTVTTLLLQLIGRHQFRAGMGSKILLGILLQAVVTLMCSLIWPPRTVAGVVLQTTQAVSVGVLAGLLTPLVLWGAENIARRYFELDLESRLKDL